MDLEEKAKVIANLKSKQGLRDKFIYDSRKQNVACLAFRKNLLESQLRVNQVNEFDRLKGYLYANKGLPAPTKTYYKERMEKLQNLAKESIYGKYHLYKDNVGDQKKDLEGKKYGQS